MKQPEPVDERALLQLEAGQLVEQLLLWLSVQQSLAADGSLPTPEAWQSRSPLDGLCASLPSAPARVARAVAAHAPTTPATEAPAARTPVAKAAPPLPPLKAATTGSTLNAFSSLAKERVRPLEQLPERPASMAAIREHIGECTRCKLHRSRKHIVFGEGAEDAELMFVGEGPGADEDATGRPFVGAAGQLRYRIIEAMGLQRSTIFIGNVVKCRPPGNRDPEPDEIAACRGFLLQQVVLVQPKIIVSWGRVATHLLLQIRNPITHIRGHWHSLDGIAVMPTLHPSYLLRQPSAKKLVWEDMQAVLAKLGL